MRIPIREVKNLQIRDVVVKSKNLGAYGVVDNGCNSSVCGRQWFNAFSMRARKHN